MATTTKSSGSLRNYLITRLALVIPMVLILVTLVFFMMRVVGDPIESRFGGQLSPAEIAKRRHAAGLDRPLLTQYFDYLWGICRGDFGSTITDNREVSEILRINGAATLELTFWALLVALVLGVPLGRIAARYRDRLPDVTLRLFAVLCYAIPVFFLGLLLKLVFAIKLEWFYASGRASPDVEQALNTVSPNTHVYFISALQSGDPSYMVDIAKHTVLPAVTLGLLTAGVFTRLVRVNLLQTMRADYVEAARARGIRESVVIRKHAFRNALIPVITVMGLQIAALLAGAVLTETTFEWQGLGYQIAYYLRREDYIAVQGIVTAIAVIVALISFLIDVLAAIIDPRVRY